MPTCCCMWWTRPTRTIPSRWPKCRRVLQEIGADTVPQLLVFNKLDALESYATPRCICATRSTSTACRCRASSSAPTPARACRRCARELAQRSQSTAEAMTPEHDTELHDAAD